MCVHALRLHCAKVLLLRRKSHSPREERKKNIDDWMRKGNFPDLLFARKKKANFNFALRCVCGSSISAGERRCIMTHTLPTRAQNLRHSYAFWASFWHAIFDRPTDDDDFVHFLIFCCFVRPDLCLYTRKTEREQWIFRVSKKMHERHWNGGTG